MAAKTVFVKEEHVYLMEIEAPTRHEASAEALRRAKKAQDCGYGIADVVVWKRVSVIPKSEVERLPVTLEDKERAVALLEDMLPKSVMRGWQVIQGGKKQ